MIRYIRTKDEIIDLTSRQVSSYEIIDDKTAIDEYGEDGGFIMVYYYNQDVGEHIERDNKGGHSMDNWYLKDILKQADTIEELCDCYLEDCGRGVPAIITKTMWVDLHMEKSLRGETSFYACIIKRDEKGVHIEPFAKLNEKGEFELL